MTDALIDASGVRRSWDTAASSAVRSSLASASSSRSLGVGPERPLLHRDRRPARRTPGAPRRSSSLEPSPAQHEHVGARRAGPRRSASSGLVGHRRRRAAATTVHVVVDAVATAPPTESASNADLQLRDELGSGSSAADERAAERGQRLGFARAPAPPRRCGASRGRRARSRRRRPAGRSPARARFSPSAIVNSWNGGVKNQFASRKPEIAADERRARSRRARRRPPRAGGTSAGRSAA